MRGFMVYCIKRNTEKNKGKKRKLEQTKENKMGVMPVNKLLVTMSLPIVISMLIQAMYNLVDSVFVAQINPDALTAVGMAFPMQSLMRQVLRQLMRLFLPL